MPIPLTLLIHRRVSRTLLLRLLILLRRVLPKLLHRFERGPAEFLYGSDGFLELRRGLGEGGMRGRGGGAREGGRGVAWEGGVEAR